MTTTKVSANGDLDDVKKKILLSFSPCRKTTNYVEWLKPAASIIYKKQASELFKTGKVYCTYVPPKYRDNSNDPKKPSATYIETMEIHFKSTETSKSATWTKTPNL